MPFFLLFILVLSPSWSQTRPTGGTGPDIDNPVTRVTSLGGMDLLISENFDKQFDHCGLKITKPGTLNIYQIYLTLYPLNFLNSLTALKLYQLQLEPECSVGTHHVNPTMKCLFHGSEVYLNSFVDDRETHKYLEDQYNLTHKEANAMVEFFKMISLSIRDNPVKR